MSKYLFIESRDPFESADTSQTYELANALSQEGNEVTIFFVQNGVFAARKGIKALEKIGKASVLADDYSLNERGIASKEVSSNVHVSSIDKLVDLLAEKGTKAIWH
jgi:sulfur relay protein TusB/DsrH